MKQLFFLLIIFPFFSHSQVSGLKEIPYEVGTPYHVIDAYQKKYFQNDGQILTVKFKEKKLNNKEYFIQKLDAVSMKINSTERYNNKYNLNVTPSIRKINDKLLIFYQHWEKTTKIYYNEIDFNTGKLKDGYRLFATLEGDKQSFNYITVSTDESKLLLKKNEKLFWKLKDNEHRVIDYSVFDHNLNLIWNKKVKLPYPKEKISIEDYILDSFGNVCLLAKVFKEDHKNHYSKDKSINYHLEIIKFNGEELPLSQTKIELDNHYVNDIEIHETENGNIVCVGYYHNGRKTDIFDGLIVFKMNDQNEVINFTSLEIPLEVLNQYKIQDFREKNEIREREEKYVGMPALRLRNVVTQPNGSIFIIGEQYFSRDYTQTSNGQTNGYNIEHYNDVFITKLDPNGALEWMKLLPKRQRTTRSYEGFGFKYHNQNNNHYFILVDHCENLKLNMDENPEVLVEDKGGCLIAYKISDNGEITKFSILDMDKIPELNNKPVDQFSIDRIINSSENEFLVEFYKKNKEDIFIKFRIP